MSLALTKVLLVAAAIWCLVAVNCNPVSVMHGDLCRRLNGRKYYLEADTRAVVTATNVTLPAFPRIATQKSKGPSVPYQHSPRRHRREGPQEIGLISEPRFRRNITTITLASLAASSDMVAPKTSFNQPPESTRILSPLRTPTLEEHIPATASPPLPPTDEEVPTTSSPLLIKESQDEMKSDLDESSDVSTALNQPIKCGVEILTRPDCHLELTFEKVNLPSCSHDKSCRCDYVRLREPPYRGVGGLDICSMGDETPNTFTTQTKEVKLDFLYTRAYEDAFAIGITAKRNKYRIIGQINSTVGYIRSPFFPELYPKEHWMEYELVAQEENARIKVTFLDFQLSPWSFVEIQDTNQTRLAIFNGNLFRPPVLVSSGPHLTLRFNGNGETARGFNMQYAFVDKKSNAIVPPITDCGGYVTNFGGTITMMNMSQEATSYTMYDCVWIVQPPQNYAFKSHLSIKVVQFEEMASATTLEIRQGTTSDDYLMERIEGSNPTKSEEHVVAVDTGFYVRLRGFFNKDSKLAIVYSSFSYLGSCYSLTDLMCHNHRCIPKLLRCDGFDHCGDNSDEPASCYIGAGSTGLTPQDAAWWYKHTPNYYFPQKSPFLGGQHGWSGVLLLTSLIVMVILMVGLISYMFKQGSMRERRERRHGAHGTRGSLTDDVEVVDASADDPPLYEPPPDYEEVIKVILSGNNLKLVRRPGGVTAWVPDKLANEGNSNRTENDRPLRTRHASLDMEHGMEVVLWNSNNTVGTPRNTGGTDTSGNTDETGGNQSTDSSFRLGHHRRSSLPTAPTPETMRHNVQGHSVSVAPETIPEGPESLESPRPVLRHAHTLSSPQISVSSFNYDTSAVSTPGTSTPQVLRAASQKRKSKKVSKKGGRRKKSSATRKPEQPAVRDDSLPPSYEDAMQQVIQKDTNTTNPSTEEQANSDFANQVNESTQTSIDQNAAVDAEDLSPSDRVHAARELFQKLSAVEKKPRTSTEAHSSQHAAKRPSVQASRTRHQKGSTSNGTISRGTVKARKAMLLKLQKPQRDCECNGACSCAYFKPEELEEPSHKGGVKSKVQYYLNIEESTKKREYESSIEQSPTEENPQESMQTSELPPANITSAALKKRKLVRNQSAPTIGRIRDLDLDIYFSQNDTMEADTPSPGEDMERPLITPVTDSRPIFIVPQKGDDKIDGPNVEGVPSILNKVKLYNELTKAETPLPLPSRTPSPLYSPDRGILLDKMLRSESIESTEGEGTGIICVKALKTEVCDTNIKPGLVKEATAKLITTLATDIRPKLCQQDSDDWNHTGNESPLPVRIPYHNLRNEVSSSPDICENENLGLPPLRKEEAESIELWDSISQGRSEPDTTVKEAILDTFAPSPSSGAVPKKSVGEVTIKLGKKNSKKGKNKQCHNQEQKLPLKSEEIEKDLEFQQTKKVSPASFKEKECTGNLDLPRASSPQPSTSKIVLEEINLGTAMAGYPSSSDDDSLPPSPQIRRRLNETFESDIDMEASLKTAQSSHSVSPVNVTSEEKGLQEKEVKKKIPIPSPRGSKSLQPKICQNQQQSSPVPVNVSEETQPKEDDSPITSSPVKASVSISSVGPPVMPSTNDSSTSSTPKILRTPTLSPQMERSGIVTINTNKRLKWDYI